MNDQDYAGLAGSIQRVHLKERIPGFATIGTYKGHEIEVSGGDHYEGDSCLTRFGFKDNSQRERPHSTFITSEVPTDLL